MAAQPPYGHIHVSERQPGPWIDCVWDSGVMVARMCRNRSIPATHAEGDRLRAASGDTGLSNLNDLDTAFALRYDWISPKRIVGWAEIRDALDPGTGAVIQGGMDAWRYGSPWRRWDANYIGGHATAIFRTDTTLTVWWDDPLAPNGIGYRGERMGFTDLEKFYKAGPAGVGAMVMKLLPPPVVDPRPWNHTVKVIADDGLNVRTAPRMGSTIVDHLPKGARKDCILMREKGGSYTGPGGNTRTDWVGYRRLGSTVWLTRAGLAVID